LANQPDPGPGRGRGFQVGPVRGDRPGFIPEVGAAAVGLLQVADELPAPGAARPDVPGAVAEGLPRGGELARPALRAEQSIGDCDAREVNNVHSFNHFLASTHQCRLMRVNVFKVTRGCSSRGRVLESLRTTFTYVHLCPLSHRPRSPEVLYRASSNDRLRL